MSFISNDWKHAIFSKVVETKWPVTAILCHYAMVFSFQNRTAACRSINKRRLVFIDGGSLLLFKIQFFSTKLIDLRMDENTQWRHISGRNKKVLAVDIESVRRFTRCSKEISLFCGRRLTSMYQAADSGNSMQWSMIIKIRLQIWTFHNTQLEIWPTLFQCDSHHCVQPEITLTIMRCIVWWRVYCDHQKGLILSILNGRVSRKAYL